MKRIKKIYRENRILFILLVIVIVCVISMGVVLFNYFYSGVNTTKYGDRLDGIEKVEIAESRISEMTMKLKENKLISEADISVSGKIVYTSIKFNSNASLVEAQSIALAYLDEYSEAELGFYDFHFYLEQDKSENSEGFKIEGAHNKGGTNLVWNNNNVVSEEENEETEK